MPGRIFTVENVLVKGIAEFKKHCKDIIIRLMVIIGLKVRSRPTGATWKLPKLS
jgi:hypothetical protein